MLTTWMTLIAMWAQGQPELRFIKPVESVFAGKTEFSVETDASEDEILGLELFINGQSAHYFETAPFRTTIDLSEYPQGEIRFQAVLLMFGDRQRSVELVGRNYPSYVEEDVQLVRVPVMIQRAGDERDFTTDQFLVYENGQPQRVDLLFDEEKPMHLVVLLDLSGSMYPRLVMLRRGMLTLLDAMRPGDSVHLIGFNHSVFEICPPETDMSAVKRKLHLIEAQGSTNLYGAVWSGVNSAGKSDQRRALLLFTDGQHELEGMEDFYNKTLDDCIALANERGVPIYAMGLGRGINPDALRDLAGASGGQAFLLSRPRSLREAFELIGRELRYQYLLYYYSQSRKKGWHRVEVKVKDRADLVLRYPKRLYFNR